MTGRDRRPEPDSSPTSASPAWTATTGTSSRRAARRRLPRDLPAGRHRGLPALAQFPEGTPVDLSPDASASSSPPAPTSPPRPSRRSAGPPTSAPARPSRTPSAPAGSSSRRRRGPRPLPGGRPGPEHERPGRLQPGLEAGRGPAVRGPGHPAGQLRGGAPARRRAHARHLDGVHRGEVRRGDATRQLGLDTGTRPSPRRPVRHRPGSARATAPPTASWPAYASSTPSGARTGRWWRSASRHPRCRSRCGWSPVTSSRRTGRGCSWCVRTAMWAGAGEDPVQLGGLPRPGDHALASDSFTAKPRNSAPAAEVAPADSSRRLR
ncbi:hypothetical protein STENM223S_03261 [Streptomyces tendae]